MIFLPAQNRFIISYFCFTRTKPIDEQRIVWFSQCLGMWNVFVFVEFWAEGPITVIIYDSFDVI